MQRFPIPWFYLTRALGVFMALYGLLFDESPERGTIIIAGVGLAGYDRVARSEPASKNRD